MATVSAGDPAVTQVTQVSTPGEAREIWSPSPGAMTGRESISGCCVLPVPLFTLYEMSLCGYSVYVSACELVCPGEDDWGPRVDVNTQGLQAQPAAAVIYIPGKG